MLRAVVGLTEVRGVCTFLVSDALRISLLTHTHVSLFKSNQNEKVFLCIRFSPFASLDLGIRSFHDSDWDEFEYSDTKEWKSVGFFMRPAVGVSLRTTNNSYFEARVGYSLSSKLKGYERDEYNYYYDVVKDVNTPGLFFTIGWTHTFGWPK